MIYRMQSDGKIQGALDAGVRLRDGCLVPARPIDWKYRTWRERIRDAWAVFTGKADAFRWPGGQ